MTATELAAALGVEQFVSLPVNTTATGGGGNARCRVQFLRLRGITSAISKSTHGFGMPTHLLASWAMCQALQLVQLVKSSYWSGSTIKATYNAGFGKRDGVQDFIINGVLTENATIKHLALVFAAPTPSITVPVTSGTVGRATSRMRLLTRLRDCSPNASRRCHPFTISQLSTPSTVPSGLKTTFTTPR